MKKTIFIAALVVGVALLSLSTVSPVMAQGGSGNGRGGSGGNGNQGELGTGTGIPTEQNLNLEQNINLDGALSDLVHANLAAALNIPVEDLIARIDAGETVAQIALDLGLDPVAVSELLLAARTDAYAQAVGLGILTPEQVEWLTSRGNETPALVNADVTCDGDCVPDQTQTCQSSMTKSRQRSSFGK